MGLGHADERFRFRLGQAAAERRIPMPGSISTGTAPTLKRAKEAVKKSSDGGTISTVRVPRRMPMASKAFASPIALLVQLAERQVGVGDAVGPVPAVRHDDREPVRIEGGHRFQVAGDVRGRIQRSGFHSRSL